MNIDIAFLFDVYLSQNFSAEKRTLWIRGHDLLKVIIIVRDFVSVRYAIHCFCCRIIKTLIYCFFFMRNRMF